VKSTISEIYKGYLDLIQYLEEKFPGGVSIRYNHAKILMKIRPTTEATLNAFIRPACWKFNELGTTRIDAYNRRVGSKDDAVVCTEEQKAIISVLYYVSEMYIPLKHPTRTIKLNTVKRYTHPGIEADKDMEAMTLWLEILTADHLRRHNLYIMEKGVEQYEDHHDVHPEEAGRLRKWIRHHP